MFAGNWVFAAYAEESPSFEEKVPDNVREK